MAVLSVEDCATSRAPGRLLRRIDKTMAAIISARFDRQGISYQQWVALKIVRDGFAATAGELAREVGITTGATTRLVDVLEARGLLGRVRGDGDRRVIRLHATPAGREAVDALQDRVVAVWNEVLAGFTQQQADTLVENLITLLAAAERASAGVPALEIEE